MKNNRRIKMYRTINILYNIQNRQRCRGIRDKPITYARKSSTLFSQL